MILSCEQMRAMEERVFATGVEPEALMDRAGAGIAGAVRQFFPGPGTCVVYNGKGHNSGDGLVAARHLADAGWKIALRFVSGRDELSPLTAKKLAEFEKSTPGGAIIDPDVTTTERPLVQLDGLLGIGARGPLRPAFRELTVEMNRRRAEDGAFTFAIDIPTGLNGDTGEADEGAVRADFTTIIACAKSGLVADSAIDHTGRLIVVPLPELTPDGGSGIPAESGEEGLEERLLTAPGLAPLLPPRDFSAYKNRMGHVGIVAGSVGFTGAAVMASAAAVRAGAGLVTLFAPDTLHPILAVAAPPEVMVHPVKSYLEAESFGLDVLAVGPGLGRGHRDDVLRLINKAHLPVVVDADALNILATENIARLKRCPAPRLLTPHPGEMARLVSARYPSRLDQAVDFAETFPVTLLLKGARTVITEAGRPAAYNTTGGPGLASGGMGDVLTGVCAALAGQGLPFYDAACLGIWLVGRATEIAVFGGDESEQSFSATGVIAHLGKAFQSLRNREF